MHLSFGPPSVTFSPTQWLIRLQCVVSVVDCIQIQQPPFTQLSGFSFKMRTRLTVCVGTGGPHGQEGGLQGLEQGGAEERGPTKTEERRQTGQPSRTSDRSQSLSQGGHSLGICKEWPVLSSTTGNKTIIPPVCGH